MTSKTRIVSFRRRSLRGWYATGLMVVSLLTAPVAAQDRRATAGDGDYEQEVQPLRPTPAPATPVNGRTARSIAGQTGVRQSREQAGIVPMARIDSRIGNRVQSRIRNRIDRNYDPSANATSPFVIAGAQRGTLRASGR